MTAALAVLPLEPHSLPRLIDRAASALTNARSRAEVLEAQGLALEALKRAHAEDDAQARSDARLLFESASTRFDLIMRGRTTIPAETKRELLSGQFFCWLCGRADEPLEVDHMHPVSRGGGNEIENLIVTCRTCNRRKGTLSLHDFIGRERKRRKAEAEEYLAEAIRLDALADAVRAKLEGAS